MNKIFILFLIILTSCGYEPLYKVNQNTQKLQINEVKYLGNQKINERIYSKLPFVLLKNDENLNKLVLESENKVEITSKNSKGQAVSYRTIIKVKIIILNNMRIFLTKK